MNPPPGATFHGYGLFTDNASFAYTGVYQQRPDQEPPVGMDPPGCNTAFTGAPVYYPEWVLLTSDAMTWLENGSGFGCQGGHYWYQGYGFNGTFTTIVPPQWGFATTSARVFQIYRVAEVWHFLVGSTEYASMTWNAVGPYVEAGIESYNANVGTAYLVHNSMNKTLSESGWIAFNGFAHVGGQNSARMCSIALSAASFEEKQFAPGTSC